jgi:hypothetical protein
MIPTTSVERMRLNQMAGRILSFSSEKLRHLQLRNTEVVG